MFGLWKGEMLATLGVVGWMEEKRILDKRGFLRVFKNLLGTGPPWFIYWM